MQSIQTPLEAVLTGYTRRLRLQVRASWLKVQDSNIAYGIVGSSVVGGTDIVQGASAVIGNADLFSYMDESDYAMRLDYERSIDEPRGGTSHAIADILLDNITRRFTPEYNATIGTALEARRPFKASIGMEAGGVDRYAQVIVGLSSTRPKLSRTSRTVEVQIFDYITFIDNAQLQAAVYENLYSHEIIEEILQDLGFGSTQYMLDVGLNLIPFAWFDKDKSAGKRIREICEAEEAHLYQDENGIIRFENRNHYSEYPHQTVQRTIDSSDILSDENDDNTRIINRAIVIAKPRKIDASPSVIWSNSTVVSIPANSSTTVWAAFFDTEGGQNVLPIKEITTPASTTDYTANASSDGSGADRTANLSISVTNFVESAKLVLTNNHASTIYVTLLQLRGKAARVTQAIQQVVEDSGSINKFEAQEYTLQNDLIQTSEAALTIATNLVNKYKNPLTRRIIRIAGIPHLQLKDLIGVVNPNPENLVSNPSFELGTNGWSIVLSGGTYSAVEQSRDVAVSDGFFWGKFSVE